MGPAAALKAAKGLELPKEATQQFALALIAEGKGEMAKAEHHLSLAIAAEEEGR